MKYPVWALQDAKAKFSEVVKKAQEQGPQYISVRGEPAVVMIAQKDYENLTTTNISVVEFFRKSPLVELEIEMVRDKTKTRDVDL